MLHKSCITALTAAALAALFAFHGRPSAEEADGDLVIAARGPTVAAARSSRRAWSPSASHSPERGGAWRGFYRLRATLHQLNLIV
jgi:hypothetical protein